MIMALGGRAKGRADRYLCTRQKRTRTRREGLCATDGDRYRYRTVPVLYYCTGTILGLNRGRKMQ